MPTISQNDAEKIANKLQAVYRQGGNHKLAIIFVNGQKITQFGIRHDKTAGHDYIADQIHMNRKDCLVFGKCDISYDEWVARMREKGHIPPELQPPPPPV
jgi:hypothetical protein